MDEADHRSSNPYTAMEGYKVLDASGVEFGRVEDTVYDAVSDVLKYVVVGDGRTVLADNIEVDPGEERLSVPYDRETVESAPRIEDPSGAFDEAVRNHYEGRG